MKCQRCKEREATVQIMQQIAGKKPQTFFLCETCAREMGISIPSFTKTGKAEGNPFASIWNLFPGSFDIGAETEEIAANCLVIVVFMGAAMCVRMGRHIAVDLIYNFLPRRLGRGLEVAVDLISIGFYAYMGWLMWRYIDIVGSERMVTVDLPRGFVFYTVFVAFVLMLLRAVQNFVKDLTGRKTVREEAADSGPTGV